MEKLGIIAGAGDLPLLLAQAAVAQGRLPVIIQVTQPTSERFASVPSHIYYSMGVGQIRKVVRTFLDLGVREVVLIGEIQKGNLFRPLQLDPTAIRILTQHSGVSAILSAALDYFESKGLSVIEQHKYLPALLPQAGVLTQRQPTESQQADAVYGIALARQVANLDIGQTVVVKERIPIAIEALEGTDQTIRRGGELAGKGIVVAKAAATHHDFRIDVPTIGPGTIQVLHAVQGSVLAIEAARTIILGQEKLCEQADRCDISIVALK